MIENNQTFLCNSYDFDPTRKKSNPNFKSYEEYINKKPNDNNFNDGFLEIENVKINI